MFRGKTGKRNFNSCLTREVEFIETTAFSHGERAWSSDGPIDRAGINAIANVTGLDPKKIVFLRNGTYSAELHCPRTESEKTLIKSPKTDYPDQVSAFDALKSLAIKTVCEDCPYSGMTRIEAITLKTEQAKAEAEKAQAEILRREALAELEANYPVVE